MGKSSSDTLPCPGSAVQYATYATYCKHITFGVGMGFARGRVESSFAGSVATGPTSEGTVGSTNSLTVRRTAEEKTERNKQPADEPNNYQTLTRLTDTADTQAGGTRSHTANQTRAHACTAVVRTGSWCYTRASSFDERQREIPHSKLLYLLLPRTIQGWPFMHLRKND